MYSLRVFVDAFDGVVSFDGSVDMLSVDVFDNATRFWFMHNIWLTSLVGSPVDWSSRSCTRLICSLVPALVSFV